MSKRQRGTSIPEVLTVTVIIGMLLSAMVVIVPILAKSPMQMQAQVDEVNKAAIALYKIRRDFAEGDTTGIYGCTTSPVSCSSPPAPPLAPTPVQALIVPTAEDASGAFQIDTWGNPLWKGFYVYWLVLDPSGTTYTMMRVWEPSASIYVPHQASPTGATVALANAALTAALALPSPPVLTGEVAAMKLGDNPIGSTIDFELVSGTIGGVDKAQTDFQSNTYARN